MKQDFFDKELQTKLDEDQIKVPEFSMRISRWSRLIHFLASPTRNPLEKLISNLNGLVILKVSPVIGAALLAVLQALFIL